MSAVKTFPQIYEKMRQTTYKAVLQGHYKVRQIYLQSVVVIHRLSQYISLKFHGELVLSLFYFKVREASHNKAKLNKIGHNDRQLVRSWYQEVHNNSVIPVWSRIVLRIYLRYKALHFYNYRTLITINRFSAEKLPLKRSFTVLITSLSTRGLELVSIEMKKQSWKKSL